MAAGMAKGKSEVNSTKLLQCVYAARFSGVDEFRGTVVPLMDPRIQAQIDVAAWRAANPHLSQIPSLCAGIESDGLYRLSTRSQSQPPVFDGVQQFELFPLDTPK